MNNGIGNVHHMTRAIDDRGYDGKEEVIAPYEKFLTDFAIHFTKLVRPETIWAVINHANELMLVAWHVSKTNLKGSVEKYRHIITMHSSGIAAYTMKVSLPGYT